MISIIIPSAKDPCLQRTIDGLRDNAEGEIEIIVILDGYWDTITGADEVYFNKSRRGMRNSINRGVKCSHGKYIMKTDAHCKFGKGYDVKLLTDIQDNWVVVPRRYKLDIEKWERIDEPPTDYDRLLIDRADKIGGVNWSQRREQRKDIAVDETMLMQGSCYLMSRKHWDWLGDLDAKNYGSLMQEATEICLKTWLGGGKVMVNKLTWYAHKHRKFKRTIHVDSGETKRCYAYSKDYWLNNKWEGRIHDLCWLMKRFELPCKT
jgi:glycosyltransferase involved in cell wall biosynthesis